MSVSRIVVFLLLSTLPALAGAEVTARDLPDGTVWYLHADLEAMRKSESGSRLYMWFDEEIGAEVREEIGIDLSKEVRSITAYSDAANGMVVVSDGPLSKESREQLLAMATLNAHGDIDILEYKGMTYYHVGDEDAEAFRGDEPFEDLQDSAWFSFAIDGKAILTSTEGQLKALLDSGGKIAGSGSHKGAMFVLSADTTFVQAGMQMDNMASKYDGDWESNILKNTRQAALLVADHNGLIAVQAQLVSTDPKMAQAIGGIVNGLISLQAFNAELGSEIQELIRNTRVEVSGNTLSINAVLDPDIVAAMLAD